MAKRDVSLFAFIAMKPPVRSRPITWSASKSNRIAKVEKHGVHDFSLRVMHTLEIDHPENPYPQPPDNAARFHVELKQESLRHSPNFRGDYHASRFIAQGSFTGMPAACLTLRIWRQSTRPAVYRADVTRAPHEPLK